MAVVKVYTRINWLNKSESLTTPLGKTNLNKMDKAIDTIDNEVVSISATAESLDTTKADKDQLNNMITDISVNDKNGVISITKYNGTVLNIDTAMEKIAVNFEYNAQTQQLILTLENGKKQYIDMSALITQYEFKGTDTIAFSIDSDGKVSASIKSGSITKAMLSSEVMSAITLSESNAVASAQAAAQSATNADMDAKLSQSYSVGKSGIRDGEDIDNAKYYSEQAKKYAGEAQEIAGGNFIPKSEKGVANGVAVLNANLAVEKAVADENGNNIQSTYAKSTEMLDIKMLGWSVPRECPIQNEVSGNQFVQKVGRVDIGTLYMTKISDATRNLYSCSVLNIKPEPSRDTAINGYCYGWTAVSRSTTWKDGMFSYHSDSTVCFTTNTYTDVNSFKTAMQGKYLYYELATPITKTIDGNEIGETVRDVRKETITNLLNPTLQTVTKNEVTCTNNGDGTYTLNGTASADANFFLQGYYGSQTPIINKVGRFKVVVLDNKHSGKVRLQIYHNETILFGLNDILTVTQDTLITLFNIQTVKGVTYDNVIIKPMLTTNLSATYDDFVPYTGDTGSLNGDVADIRKDVDDKLSKSSVVNNLVTTNEGYALDARQGAALDEKITELNDSLSVLRAVKVFKNISGVTIKLDGACIDSGADVGGEMRYAMADKIDFFFFKQAYGNGYGTVMIEQKSYQDTSPVFSLKGTGSSWLNVSVANTSPLTLSITHTYGGIFSLNIEYTPSITTIS